MNILVTGAGGMLGRYLLGVLPESPVQLKCDLECEVPQFGGASFDVVYHLAGSEEDENAALNDEGTERLLRGLETSCISLPRRMVYVSSHQVYGADCGENVAEDHPLYAVSEAGRSKARAEAMLVRWCAAHWIELVIVRPARMFGTGVHGEMARLFDRVIASRYVHVRGNEARVSLVTALDVARVLAALADVEVSPAAPLLLNISDGRPHRWLDLCEAMTENTGARRRMPTLPEKWAKWIYRLFGGIPMVEGMLGPKTQKLVSRTMVMDVSRLRSLYDAPLYDTLEVIARRARDYSYQEN